MGPPKFDADFEDRVRYLRIGTDGVPIGVGRHRGESNLGRCESGLGLRLMSL